MCYDTLCLSGGGINGLDIIGSLKYLDDNNIIKINKINNFIGTSVGCIVNILLIIGYSINMIIKIIYKLDFQKIKIEFDIDNFFENFGIDNGSRIISIIQTLIFNKLGVYDLTFKELYNRTNKKLNIIVVNFSKQKEELLSIENNPDMSVILALRMSISIPFVFFPVKFNKDLYIDGGLLNNFGMNYCEMDKTIGICIDTVNNSNPENIVDFLKSIMSLYHKAVTTNNKVHENIICIENNSEYLSFDIDKEMKYKLIKNGYKKTKLKVKNKINFYASKFINNIIDSSIKKYLSLSNF